MSAEDFCAENAHETLNGRINFSIPVTDKFIKIYTHLNKADFSKEAYKRLRLHMIDYYGNGIKYNRSNHSSEAEKITLPDWIFQK